MQLQSLQRSTGRPLHSSALPRTRCPGFLRPHLQQHQQHSSSSRQLVRATDAVVGGSFEGQEPEREYKPFSRLKESDPYRLLGLSKDAGYEEVLDARNYLYEHYKWHEPSRESIELAFDKITEERLKERNKLGFRPIIRGRRGEILREPRRLTLMRRVEELFDPTITLRDVVNEGVVFAVFAFWSYISADQSFPLAATFGYSVFKFQSKRVKQNPEGPHFGGSPIVGAILTTLFSLSVSCAAAAAVTAPFATALGPLLRNVGSALVALAVGVLCVYIK